MHTYLCAKAEMNSSNIPKLRAWSNNLQGFSTDLKVHTLRYEPAKTNENGAFESLNESIDTGSSSRKAGPEVNQAILEFPT